MCLAKIGFRHAESLIPNVPACFRDFHGKLEKSERHALPEIRMIRIGPLGGWIMPR